MNITDLAEKYGVTRQAIFMKVKEGRIKALKEKGHWIIEEEDYLNFVKGKHKRDPKIFDNSKGIYSATQSAELIDCPLWRIYYFLRNKELKSKRHRKAYLIHIDDLMDCKDDLVMNRRSYKRNDEIRIRIC